MGIENFIENSQTKDISIDPLELKVRILSENAILPQKGTIGYDLRA